MWNGLSPLSPTKMQGFMPAAVHAFSAIPAVGRQAFALIRLQAHRTYLGTSAAGGAVGGLEMDAQTPFKPQKRQEAAKRTKGPAEKPEGEQLEQDNRDDKHPFQGQLAEEYRHHDFPADEPWRREKNKKRRTEHHADDQLANQDKPQ